MGLTQSVEGLNSIKWQRERLLFFCLTAKASSPVIVGTDATGSCGSQASGHRQEPHPWLAWVPSLQMTDVGLLHNHVDQFLTLNLCVYVNRLVCVCVLFLLVLLSRIMSPLRRAGR